MQKILAFSIMWFLGRVGRGRLLSISVEHCNLKWLMQNINENVNLWDGVSKLSSHLDPVFSGKLHETQTRDFPRADTLHLTRTSRAKCHSRHAQGTACRMDSALATAPLLDRPPGAICCTRHISRSPAGKVSPATASRDTLTPKGAEWQALGLRHITAVGAVLSPAWENAWMPSHSRKASCSGHPTLLHGK